MTKNTLPRLILNPNNLRDIKNLNTFISDCLNLEGQQPWPDIAAKITGAMCAPESDDWEENLNFPEVSAIFNLSSDMEIPEVYGSYKADQLAIKHLAKRLSMRLNDQPTNPESITDFCVILQEYAELVSKDIDKHWQLAAGWLDRIINLLGNPKSIEWYGKENYGALIKIAALTCQLANCDKPNLESLAKLKRLIADFIVPKGD